MWIRGTVGIGPTMRVERSGRLAGSMTRVIGGPEDRDRCEGTRGVENGPTFARSGAARVRGEKRVVAVDAGARGT